MRNFLFRSFIPSILSVLAACGGGGGGGGGSSIAPPPSACPAFGTNGIGFATTDVGGDTTDKIYALAIQPGPTDCDSKIVAAGTSSVRSTLVRYNYDGSVDASFGPSGSNGIVTIDFGGATTTYAMTLDSLGRIVVAGSVFNTTTSSRDFLIARYDGNGILDTANFGGSAGYVTTNFGGREDNANAVAIDSQGRIVAAGTSCAAGSLMCTTRAAAGSDASDIALARYLENGDLDLGFSTDGKVRLSITGENIGALALVIQQPGDKPLMAGFLGSASGAPPFSTSDFVLVRYDNTGTLDGTFGSASNGIVRTGFQTDRSDTASALALDSQGRIVVAGTAYNDSSSSGTYNDFAVARYDSSGILDTANFGGGTGKVTRDLGIDSNDTAKALAILPGDEIEVAGQSDAFSLTFLQVLVRFNASGSFVTQTFVDFVANAGAQANALALLPDGSLIVAGYATITNAGGTEPDFALARVNP